MTNSVLKIETGNMPSFFTGSLGNDLLQAAIGPRFSNKGRPGPGRPGRRKSTLESSIGEMKSIQGLESPPVSMENR